MGCNSFRANRFNAFAFNHLETNKIGAILPLIELRKSPIFYPESHVNAGYSRLFWKIVATFPRLRQGLASPFGH